MHFPGSFLSVLMKRLSPPPSYPPPVSLPVTWEMEERVQAATEDQPGPSSCPPDRLFVLDHLHSDVLQWGHASRFTCHPGIQRTQDFLQQCFWWSSLEKDVRGYVNTCPLCNQNKTARRPPAGFLHLRLFLIAHGHTSPWTL